MSEQVKVPAIRFEGFGGEWRTFIFDELFPITSAARVHKHEWTESGVPFFRTSDVVAAYKGEGNAKAFISNKLYLELTAKIGRIRKGDLLVTGGGSIGTPYLVNSDDPLYFKDADLLWFKVRKSVNSYLLYTFFNTSIFRRYIKSISHIGTIAHYTVEQAKATPIALPIKDKEQQKIGGFFKQLDANLHHHQTKLDKLKTLKQAMLQGMFPQGDATEPEIRFKGFSGEWKADRFGDLVLVQRGGSPRPIEAFITQGNDGVNWVKIGDVSPGSRYINKTKEKIKPEGASSSRWVYKGDLILSNSMSFGRPYIMNIDGCIHDGWLLIRNEKSIFDLEFLLQLLSSEMMLSQYRELASGGVVNNLNSALVQSTIVVYPKKKEQQKIGAYFRKLDELIALERTQLDKLKQIKQACLAGMFV